MISKECKWFCCCPIKYFKEQGKLDKKWVKSYCHEDWENCVRFQKEENGIYHPDNMLPNGKIDNKRNFFIPRLFVNVRCKISLSVLGTFSAKKN